MPAKALMIQGVASNVGKSVLATALCRIFAQDGYRVAPFKAWNMALNSYVTRDGLEIGRAQGVQAEAAGVEATADMNPFLLKPKGNMTSQVIMRGRPWADVDAGEGRRDFVNVALPVIEESLGRLRTQFDIIVIEGAGSPAEINLRDRDVANMRVAKMANAPVLLVADIDRGGALAAIVGTLTLLPEDERGLVAGSVLNKFRGDFEILRPGIEILERRTGKPVVGVVPYIDESLIDEEDSVSIERPASLEAMAAAAGGAAVAPGAGPAAAVAAAAAAAGIEIAVIRLPHISNFTDFDALAREPGVRVRYIRPGESLEGIASGGGFGPDAIIIPGTKNTISDLRYLREAGYAAEIIERVRRGAQVMGICGGYQMLGRVLRDPYHTEAGTAGTGGGNGGGNGCGDDGGAPDEVPGLGLLPTETTFYPGKRTIRVRGRVIARAGWLGELAGQEISGYEIHMGRTTLLGDAVPVFQVQDEVPTLTTTASNGDRVNDSSDAGFEGAVSPDGLVMGTYLHGVFDNDGFRRAFINHLRRKKGLSPLSMMEGTSSRALRELNFDKLAALVRRGLNMDAIYGLIGVRKG
ncbi:MAG: cobyric acid synthase [Firmicutes bacterium]|nr:cobyric acid synthase [Bacillota bacterium]